MSFIWKTSLINNTKILISSDPTEGEIRMPYWTNNSIIHIRYKVGVYSSEIFTMNSEGLEIKKLTMNNSTDTYPKYSEMNKKVLFTSQPQNAFPQILIMDVDGSNLRQLTSTGGYTCDWSPDGRSIVYTDSRAVNGRLWIMNADGSNKKQLTSNSLK